MEKYALSAVVSKAMWTQQSLHARGGAEHPWCVLCLQEGRQEVGSQDHRIYLCPCWREERARHLPVDCEDWAHHWMGAGRPYLYLPTTALYALPRITAWRIIPPSHQFHGRVYTDGSAMNPDLPEARVASWSVVQLNDQGGIAAYAHGLVDRSEGPEQTAEDREMVAAVVALQHSTGPLEIGTDCQNLYKGVLKGCQACARDSGLRAHLWRHMAEAGADERLRVFKIKAHDKRPGEQATAAEVMNWQGNCHADLMAKAAFQIDLSTRRDAEHNARMVHRLQTLGKWVAWQGAA
eukprot:1929711-Amphidinium_carterae.1